MLKFTMNLDDLINNLSERTNTNIEEIGERFRPLTTKNNHKPNCHEEDAFIDDRKEEK